MLPKQLLVTLPDNKVILYPSLSSFCKSFKANASAVIQAMKENRPYKGIRLKYVNSEELLNTNTKWYLGNLVGLEVKLAEFTDNDDLIFKIFKLVVQNKKKIGTQYRDLLQELQTCLNYINIGEINIG